VAQKYKNKTQKEKDALEDTLEKRYRDVRKKWDAADAEYVKGEHFEKLWPISLLD
jgi:hypothetical protein